ncbi:major facilitator superfamily domain-containing protein [Truncatella angustata]|uniref:Major facilitator superfamily domain-containing protein n=1 Tax=Truncatella angustata TaxID=152316 RepID=A0A9P8ZWF7_9PEZI|nr:major facilitator superfamily domain-containing protein [Truncatella angustata]KAH6652996.1 major facilitator superfamily domain-containing protein [Truncatella angustata]KAH8198307.1 hypothetical protein TruAng_007509 [Truncatella angustata]
MASQNDVIGNEADETSPLLGREEWQPSTRSSPTAQYQLKRPFLIGLVLCLGIFLWTLTNVYSIYPAIQLAEDAICKRHYLRHPNVTQPDGWYQDSFLDGCDLPGTQQRVFRLLSLQYTLMAVVGVLVAYPFGVLADKIGRRPVYALAAAGQSSSILWSLIVFAGWRALPVELVLIGPVFQLFGGGTLVGTAVLYAILSDVMPIRSRTLWFFFLTFAGAAGTHVGSALLIILTSSWTPWGPLIISLVLGLLNASLMLLIPETLKVDPTEEETLAERITIPEAREAFVHRTAFREHVSEAWSSLSTLVDNQSISLALLAFIMLAATYSQITALYFSNVRQRFYDHHNWVDAALPIQSFANLPILAVILPLLTYFLTPSRFGISFFRRDLLLARISAVFIPVGSLLLGMPNLAVVITGLTIITLGVGISPLLHSLVTHYVESAKTARLFALIGALMTVQKFATDPLFGWISTKAPHGFWAGLPFLILSVLGVVLVIAVWRLRSEVVVEVVPRGGDDEDATLLDEESMPLGE